MNLLAIFRKQLSEYITKSSSSCDSLIIFENNENFDISFPIEMKIWENYYFKNKVILQKSKENENLIYLNEMELKSASKEWIFKIDTVDTHDNKRCLITFMRNCSIKTTLEAISSCQYGKMSKKEDETVFCSSVHNNANDIASFRLQTIESTLRNLIEYSQYVYVNDSSIAKHKILLSTSSSDVKKYPNQNVIICGTVNDNKNGKKAQQSVEEYLRKRKNDVHLISIHKYGVRAKDDKKFVELTEILGEAISKIDMIEVKHSSALKLTFNPKQAFIMYNSARLDTLLNSFDERERNGYYEKLRTLDDIDMNLLSGNLEWMLLKQLISFPEVIEKSLCDISNGKIALHLIHKYLLSITTLFSVYYSKRRVLTENRPQLLPHLHAKINFLKAIQIILNKTLNILDIKPVSFM